MRHQNFGGVHGLNIYLERGTTMLPVGTPVTIVDPIHAYYGRAAQVECVRTFGSLNVYTITVGNISFRCRREHLKLTA